jgi:hypothetical protein
VQTSEGSAVQTIRALTPAHAAMAMIALMLVAAWVQASRSSYVPCVQDCGETFIAQHAVANYRLYGMRHALLQDHATIPAADRPTFIYTHNVHLGTLVFPMLDQLGLTALWAKQLVTLAASAAGLFYVFLTVRGVTKSNAIGLTVLAMFCTDYAGVFGFTLNALRAWHWLALFGLMHHAFRLVSEPVGPTRLHLVAIGGFCAIAFGIGYEFFTIAIVVALLVALLCSRSLSRTLLCCCCLAASTLVLFAVRQAQVVAAFGLRFWALDVKYSAAIKFTALAAYLHVPEPAAIDAFYLSHGVLRPHSSVAPLDQVLLGIWQHLGRITLPSAGPGAAASFLLGAVVSLAVTIGCLLSPLARPIFDWLGRRPPVLPPRVSLSARLFSALVLGMGVGLVGLGSLTISIYLKHQMPLIAAAYLVPKGVLLALALGVAASPGRQVAVRSAAAALALLLTADHLAIQAQNISELRPMPVAWISEVARRPGSSFAVSWIPSSVAGFTRNWVIGLQPGAERRIIDRANRGTAPFLPGDLMEVNAEDTDTIAKYRMLQPDFWLYFPTDEKAEYQATVPTCNRSYAGRLFDDLLERQAAPRLASIAFVDSGGEHAFVGELNVTGRSVEAVEIRDRSRLLARARLGCDGAGFAGLLSQSDLSRLQGSTVMIDALSYSGTRYQLGAVSITPALQTGSLPPSIARRQPSAIALSDANHALRVAAGGPGFVLFDLRDYWNR